jgi:Xaa-Pro aminopeptidase
MAGIRKIKTAEEIRKIARACKVASEVAEEIPDFTRVGMTERSVAAEMEKRMNEYGGDGIAFPTIVGSGPNSAIPHYYAGNRRIRRGDFIVTDFGCKVDNYCSDISRTFVVGEPSQKQIQVYETCYAAQRECVRMVKAGVRIESISKRSEEIISRYGKMIHSLGHGLGIKVHEQPGVGLYSKEELKSGMVITIEPGIYIRGVGGVRIEDDLLVTKNGARVLTTAPRELVRI